MENNFPLIWHVIFSSIGGDRTPCLPPPGSFGNCWKRHIWQALPPRKGIVSASISAACRATDRCHLSA